MAHIRLNTVRDVSRFLGRVLRAAWREAYDQETQTINPNAAAKLAYVSNILRACIEASDLEARVAELERRVEQLARR